MIKLYFILKVCYLISNPIIVTGDIICEKITRSTFKLSSNSTIKECEIVTIKLDEHSRRAFKLSILSNESVIESLYFHKTDGLLADSETPIYLTDRASFKKMIGAKIYKDYKFIKTTIEEYVPEMGDFRFYHNYNRSSSIVVFFKKTTIQLDGNIGPYVLRYLPSEGHAGQIKYVFAKLIIPVFQTESSRDSFFDTSALSYNLYVSNLEVVNGKLFVILHPNTINDKPPAEVMRTLLMFYNHLDMFFGNFTSPKIRLTLKGILLPDIGKPIPYAGNKELDLQLSNWSNIDSALMAFVQEKKDYLQLDIHDKIYFLSQSYFGKVHVGFREPDGEICKSPSSPRIAAVVHGDFQTYHILHLEYLARSFGGDFLKSCDLHPGILHGSTRQLDPAPLLWSSCTIDGFSSYFHESDCSYFNGIKPVLSTEIRDPKDERLTLAIKLGVQTRQALKNNDNMKVGLTINITYNLRTLGCSCVS